MKLVLIALTFASVLLAGVASRAEESLEDLKSRLEKQWEPWKGCEPGSWVQTRSKTKQGETVTESETRQTLVAIDEKGTTVETRIVTRRKDEQGKEVVELGEPSTSTMPPWGKVEYENLKDLPAEDVPIEGRKLHCRVVELEYVYKYPQPMAGLTELRAKMTMWISPEVKDYSGIVKTQGDSEKQGFLGGWSYDMKLVATDKEMEIGGRTLKCSVYKYGNTSGKEEMTSSGEFWMCAEIPLGYASTRTHMNYDMGGTKMRVEAESEVTGMEIVRPKTD